MLYIETLMFTVSLNLNGKLAMILDGNFTLLSKSVGHKCLYSSSATKPEETIRFLKSFSLQSSPNPTTLNSISTFFKFFTFSSIKIFSEALISNKLLLQVIRIMLRLAKVDLILLKSCVACHITSRRGYIVELLSLYLPSPSSTEKSIVSINRLIEHHKYELFNMRTHAIYH